jgi:hypothetical protein
MRRVYPEPPRIGIAAWRAGVRCYRDHWYNRRPMTFKRILRLPAAFVLFLLMGSAPASAQTYGARVGVSGSPDQFYFGGHVETPPVVDRLRFRPNIEIGLGDDVTVVGLNFELAYHFPQRNGWNVYAGAGPALNIIDVEQGESGAEGGFNVLLGLQHQNGLFFEIKGGAIDSPNFKFGVGYVFRR